METKTNYGTVTPRNTGGQRVFTEVDVKGALREYEESKCCYKGSAAAELNITDIKMAQGHIYLAQSIVEHRKVGWHSVAFKPGMFVDGPEHGPAVSAWSIYVDHPHTFDFKTKSDKHNIYVIPHTAFVCDCDGCLKLGWVKCSKCQNTGINRCTACRGVGTRQISRGGGNTESVPCGSCDARGKKSCNNCNGLGRLTCKTCDGSGQFKKYQALSVSWKVFTQKYFDLDGCALPENQLKYVTGKKSVYLSQDCDLDNNPLAQFPVPAIRDMSESVFQRYRAANKNNNVGGGERVIKIQQTVSAMPIAEVTAVLKGKMETFYVFGNERRIFFPNGFPTDCCCSIV